jgi:hypothetical protein
LLVTNMNDSGPGSLRQAITSGNDLTSNGTNIATLTQTSVVSPAIEGQTATVTYTITNTGPAVATNVQFSVETEDLHDETTGDPIQNSPTYGTRPIPLISIGSVVASQGPQVGTSAANSQAATIPLGTLASRSSATVTLILDTPSAGVDDLVSGTSSDQFILNSDDQLQKYTQVTIAGQPDLSAVALPPVGKATLGVPYTFQFVVTNDDTIGVDEADFAVENRLTPSSTLDSVIPGSGVNFNILGPYSATSSDTLSYSYDDGGDVGQLAAGASAIVSVTVTPTQPGPLVVLFATSSAGFGEAQDVNPVDNLAFAGVAVPPALAVSKTSLEPSKGDIQSLEVFFDAPLVAGSANHPGDYSLTTTSSGKPVEIPLRSARYDPKTQAVTLALKHPLSRTGTPLKLVLSGLTGAGGLNLSPETRVVTLAR